MGSGGPAGSTSDWPGRGNDLLRPFLRSPILKPRDIVVKGAHLSARPGADSRRVGRRALPEPPVPDFPDADFSRRGCYLTVIGPVLLNVAIGVGVVSGWALLLRLHLPSDSFGALASKNTAALPLPVAPANFPVLLDPSTV